MVEYTILLYVWTQECSQPVLYFRLFWRSRCCRSEVCCLGTPKSSCKCCCLRMCSGQRELPSTCNTGTSAIVIIRNIRDPFYKQVVPLAFFGNGVSRNTKELLKARTRRSGAQSPLSRNALGRSSGAAASQISNSNTSRLLRRASIPLHTAEAANRR